MTPRIGSLCSGYRGLDMAVEAVFGGTTAWVSDIDPGASAILAHHWPNVPNLGDLTAVDWAAVEPVDILCGGYPCQPFSTAGQRKGTADARHIWPFIATALRVLRPRIAIFENVANHLRLGFDTVLADLAALGFDAEWCLVRASEVGAPHRRERLFILAWDGRPEPADGGLAPADAHRDAVRQQPVGQPASGRAAVAGRAGAGSPAAAHAEGDHRGRLATGGRDAVQRGLRPDADGRGPAPADAAGQRRGERRPEPARQQGGLGTAGGSESPAADGIGRGPGQLHLRARELDATWGRYAPAIARWEPIQGRAVPRATDADGRLTPEFVEWDMGLPAGHVTNPAIWQGWRPKAARNAQLKALGNGVVPRQAAAAIPLLLGRAAAA